MSHASDIEDAASVLDNVARTSDLGSIPSLRNWTIPKLTAELVRKGIPFPATARKAELYRLLVSEHSGPCDQAGPSSEEVSMQTLNTSILQLHTLINSLCSRVDTLECKSSEAPAPAPVVGLTSAIPHTSVPPQVSATPQASVLPVGLNMLVPNVAPAHFIPTNLKDILDGKDVNLASLLIASHDVSENKTIACGEVSVILKAKDVRLSRKLTLAEFSMAFAIYRDVLCSVKPERREELDMYLFKVTELAHKYGGFTFYDYHKSFSAKAAAALVQYNYTVNWALVDTEIFCNHFAGLKAPVCSRCQSIAHTTEWCNTVNSSSEVNPGTSSPTFQPRNQKHSGLIDKLGRPIKYLGKSQICNNFNFGSCNYNQCRLLHVCAFCFRAHPKASCPQKSKA
ncbi:uncharacterized protein LOC130327128 [Hyla sarda]|uniref:uncharacterized protein LOC130327128 n=1 Tax=Hyla sarda TaxID=327740 RepID=UPI0024C30849|nr:uncharacterized protein LOC130327128 [Hyla sarda]